MVYDYLVTLKKSGSGFIDQVSRLLYLFALIVFAYFAYRVRSNGVTYLVVIAALLAAWGYTSVKKSRNGTAYYRLGLLVASVGWVIGPEQNWWMGGLYALAAILEKQVKFPQEIGFNQTEIHINSLPKKTIEWSAVSNVLIKDGMLTIDQKDNKLLQKEIEGEVSTDLETEFNAFAAKCIANTSVSF